MTKKIAATFGVLLFAVLVTTCQNPVDGGESIDTRTLYSMRIYPEPEHGTITLSHHYATNGTWITVYINPDPGYRLKEGSLMAWNESGGSPSPVSRKGEQYQFQCTTNNRTITGVFDPKSRNTYTVSVDRSITHGTVYAYPLFANADREISVYVIPDTGYDLVAGTLTIDGASIPETLPYKFTLPARDVTVSLRFEERGFDGLVSSARKYLSAGQYDTAASFYEEAYKKIKDNPGHQAIPEIQMYATLAKLGSMLLDDDVRNLLSGPLHFGRVPGTLEDWICDTDAGWKGGDSNVWYMDWTVPSEEAGEPDGKVTLPKIYARYQGFPSNVAFGDFDLAQGTNPDTWQKFLNLMFWGLICTNNGGLNPFIDQVNRRFFGANFEAAAAMADAFPAGERVLLNNTLKERFGLDEIYGPGGNTYIGKAELDYIFANLRAIKAAFQFLASYDWTIDFRPLLMLYELNRGDDFDDILDMIFKNILDKKDRSDYINYWKDSAVVTSFLPFNNNFLTIRNPSALSAARNELSKALTMADASMSYWYGVNGTFTAEAKAKYQWAREGWASAKTAIDSNGVFYFPKKLPKSEPGSVWVNPASAHYGLNLPKFFTPGAFNLTNLFTTERGGKTPSMFKIKWYYQDGWNMVWTDEGTLVTKPIEGVGAEDYPEEGKAEYGIYSFEVNTKNLKEIFPQGFNEFGDKAFFYKVFPDIPLWPDQPTYFKGTLSSASNLYKYYHYDYQY